MIRDGWLDLAQKWPGPEFKVYDTVNGGYGIVWHSMEGWFGGSMAELAKPERQASWMFSIDFFGALWQHYPITASCWASGNGLANTQWWSVELEGLYTMPINDAQLATAQRLIAEWAAWRGASPTRTGDIWTKNMWEHREVDVLATPNAGETACPSERYARLWAALEDDMADPRVDALIKAFGGQAAIDAWNQDGNSLLMGYGSEQREQDSLEARVLGLELVADRGNPPDHEHAGGASGPVRR